MASPAGAETLPGRAASRDRAPEPDPSPGAWRSFPFRAMGSPCELRLYGGDAVAQRAIDEVVRLERKYSRYLEDSVTTHINRSAGDTRGVEVDAETASLLDYAETAWRQSDGLFDISSGVLRRAWDFKSGRVPSQAEVEAALARIGWGRVRWQSPRVVLPRAGMELDFGGYVKEYAADRVAELCRSEGVTSGLVDLGGDLSAVGPHPDGSPWRVGIRNPDAPERALACVPLWTGGIASSGDYERFMVVDGTRYGHILNPMTGWPSEGLRAASVGATHCLIAGTAATVAMLKGSEGARWLAELGLPHVAVDATGAVHGNGLGTGAHAHAIREDAAPYPSRPLGGR